MSFKLILYSAITIFFNGFVLRRYLRDELLLSGPYILLILLPTITQPICQLVLGGVCGITVFALCSYQIYRRLPQKLLDLSGKAVFISGCDSGFGFETAKLLDDKGVKVFAGCFFKGQKGEQELVNSCSDRLVTVQLDVTSQDSVQEALKIVQAKLSGKDLWGVVNNAGIFKLGECEITPMTMYQQVMDVNYFGAIRLIQTFLPLIRRSKGRVVAVCSQGSDVHYPTTSGYNASKAALQAFMDALWMEMKKWDVKVSALYPGSFNTNLATKESLEHNLDELFDVMSPSLREDYGPHYEEDLRKIPTMDFKKESNLGPVSNAILHALFAKCPHSHYPVGFLCETITWIVTLLPFSFTQIFMSFIVVPATSIRKNDNKAPKSIQNDKEDLQIS